MYNWKKIFFSFPYLINILYATIFETKLKWNGTAGQTGPIISCSLTLCLSICCCTRPLQYKGILFITCSQPVILQENKNSGCSIRQLNSETFWVILLRASSQILSNCRRWSYCGLNHLFIFLIPNCSLDGTPWQPCFSTLWCHLMVLSHFKWLVNVFFSGHLLEEAWKWKWVVTHHMSVVVSQ